MKKSLRLVLAVALVGIQNPVLTFAGSIDNPGQEISIQAQEQSPGIESVYQLPPLQADALPATFSGPQINLKPNELQLPASVASPLREASIFSVNTEAVPSQNSHQALIDSLSAPLPQSDSGDLNSGAFTAEKDFNHRAQLEPSTDAENIDAAVPTLQQQYFKEQLLSAYENGALSRAPVSTELKIGMNRAAEDAIRQKLANIPFTTKFIYGIFALKLYKSDQLPGIVVKYYTPHAMDLFRQKGTVWKGYQLAKERMRGLFADTSIIENVTLNIDGKQKKFSWVVVQEEVLTKNILSWRAKINKVLSAMELRGVKETDQRNRPEKAGIRALSTGSFIAGPLAYHVADIPEFDLGETADGRFVHYDADRFIEIKGPMELPIRVADPKSFRSDVRTAQRRYLDSQAQNAVLDPF